MLHSSFKYCILGFGLLFAIACTQNPAPEKNALAQLTSQPVSVWPKLLDRPEKLRNGKEWDDVQNFYGTQLADLRNDPSNWEARLKLAECYMQEARVTGEHPHYYPAALSVLEPVVAHFEKLQDLTPKQKDPYFRALSHQASVQLSLHDFATAKKTAEKAIAINPYNASIYGCLVDANVELGFYADAVAACDKMVGIRPDLRSYSRVSYLRELHGDLNGAIEAMDMAVKAGYPGYEQTEWARLHLGGLYEKAEKLDLAENQYQMALAARPDYPFALAALAGLEITRGHWAEAEKLLNQASEIIPEVGFFIELAKIYQKTGRNSEASALFSKIETMMQEDIAAGHNMSLEAGRFHLELTGNLDKALEFANDEFSRRPANKEVNALMADIFMKKGDKQKAAQFRAKAKIG